MQTGPTQAPAAVVGALLAGGLGSRMGDESKPSAMLAGSPMMERPLSALAAVCAAVAVVCKRDTELPALPAGIERWEEPDEPRHPLTGIVHALERAGGPVLVCAADMPFVAPATLQGLARRLGGSTAVVGRAAGRLQPVLAAYAPAALPVLLSARPDSPLTATVERLHPVVVDVPEREAVSVDTPEALERAERILQRGGRPPDGTAAG